MKFIHTSKIVFIFLVLFILLPSCFSQNSNKKYYEIYYSSTKLDKNPLPYTIMVNKFNIDKIYDRFNIIDRTSSYELEYSKTKFWAVKPERMIADLITNQIKAKKMFKNVISKYNETPDFILYGRVLALDNIKSDEDVFARISIELKILDFNTNKIINSYKFERRKEVPNKSMVYVTREMSNILQEEVDKFLIETYEKLSDK